MFNYESNWTDAAIRRFIAKVGIDNIDDLLILQKADMKSMNLTTDDFSLIDEFENRIKSILEKKNALTIKDLEINGYVLHKEAQIAKGPLMGKILSALLDEVLENPTHNERVLLLTRAEELYRDCTVEETKDS